MEFCSLSKQGTTFATSDLETDPFQRKDLDKPGRMPKAFCAGFFVKGVFHLFEGENCCRELVAFCVKHKLLIYFHNGGKFDLHFLIEFLLEIFPCEDIEITCIGSRMVAVKTPLCEFRDSFSLIPKALKHIAGAGKLELPFWKLEKDAHDLTREQWNIMREDVNKAFPHADPEFTPSPRVFYRDEIIKYLKQDCVGLYHSIEEFETLYGLGLTLAGTAFKLMRKEFGMPTVKTRESYDTLFRSFYYAGRVQFFKLGRLANAYKIVDINSAFPFAMTMEHWFSGEYRVGTKIPDKNKEQCFYEITCDSLGALPLRTSKGIVFPSVTNGDFFATGWELFSAVDCGLVSNVKVKRVYAPAELRSFKEYVAHFYELKLNAKNVSERDFAKLFLNAAYGKFSQNPRVFTDVTVTKFREHSVKHMETLGWSHSYDDDARGLSFYQRPTYGEDGRDEKGKQMEFYNVCTAASITGYVRAFLMRSMQKCKGVVYCDTDSIIAEDVSTLNLTPALGDWKLELESDQVHIGGKKLYAAHKTGKEFGDCRDDKGGFIGWKTASKGVRLLPSQIIKVCAGEAQSYSFEAPNYSVFSKPHFTRRVINRADKQK